MAHAEPVAFDKLLAEAQKILRGRGDRDEKMLAVCAILKDRVPYYAWIGFYLRDGKKPELVLGPYDGEPTEHTRIAFGRGICGQAAERRQTFVVPDVAKETNYLSCSAKVRSEIVVPIMKSGEVAGELDIDSHALDPFTAADRAFLEELAAEVANVL